MSDNVNNPKHYTSHPSGVECIQITRHMSFNLGNVIKYLWRADEKGAALEDLKKAHWYLDDEIKRREGEIQPRKVIELTPAEIQSGLDRVKWAQGLISQLPRDHEGRNSWLLNYGTQPDEPQPDADGWIEWHGGTIPVPCETRVEARLRGGKVIKWPAGDVSWGHGRNIAQSKEVIAYRIVKEKEE